MPVVAAVTADTLKLADVTVYLMVRSGSVVPPAGGGPIESSADSARRLDSVVPLLLVEPVPVPEQVVEPTV